MYLACEPKPIGSPCRAEDAFCLDIPIYASGRSGRSRLARDNFWGWRASERRCDVESWYTVTILPPACFHRILRLYTAHHGTYLPLTIPTPHVLKNPPGSPYNNTSRLHRRPRLRTSIRRGIQASVSVTSTASSQPPTYTISSLTRSSEIRRRKPRQWFRLRLPLLLRPHP